MNLSDINGNRNWLFKAKSMALPHTIKVRCMIAFAWFANKNFVDAIWMLFVLIFIFLWYPVFTIFEFMNSDCGHKYEIIIKITFGMQSQVFEYFIASSPIHMHEYGLPINRIFDCSRPYWQVNCFPITSFPCSWVTDQKNALKSGRKTRAPNLKLFH